MTVPTDTVIISGDSWAAGPWPRREPNKNAPIPKQGISHRLVTAGYQVRNLAKPGGSNLESIDRLDHYLQCNQHEIPGIRFILFWKTEFFREIWYYNTIIPSEDDHGYVRIKEHWVHRPYHRLAELSQRWNLPIYVIGGCSDTIWYDDFERDFPGVKIVCQSMTNLLMNGDHRIQVPVFCEFMPGWIDTCDFLTRMKTRSSAEDLAVLIEDMNLGMDRVNDFKKIPQLFCCDQIHPNDAAHGILFEHLLGKIPELHAG